MCRSSTRKIEEIEARRLLSGTRSGNLSTALKTVIRGLSHERWLTVREAAQLANISVRSLQRTLASEGENYSQLVDRVRKELASELLNEDGLSRGELAAALGYSTTTNFLRAQRRWQEQDSLDDSSEHTIP